MGKGTEMKLKKYLKEAAEGAALGLLITGMLFGAVKINAAGADTDLPEEYQQYCEEIGQSYGICPELLEAIIDNLSTKSF